MDSSHRSNYACETARNVVNIDQLNEVLCGDEAKAIHTKQKCARRMLKKVATLVAHKFFALSYCDQRAGHRDDP